MQRILAAALLGLISGMAQAADSIRVYNWNDYIVPQVLENFTRDTGIEVEYHTFASVEELSNILNSNPSIDVITPSHDMLTTLITSGRIRPLDFELLPNRTHLDKYFLSKLVAVDPQNRHAVPYLWGLVGLAINTQQAETAYGGPLPNSWSLLFDAKQSKRLADCGISILDAQEETLSLLANYQGHSLASSTTSRIERIGNALEGLRPNLRYVDSERYTEDLSKGRLCMALAWIGDAFAAKQAGQPIRFMVPDEGSALFIDTLAIPTNASRPDLAHRFINYVMQPKVIAQITNGTFYPNANADAMQFIDPSLYPDKGTMRRLYLLESLSDSDSHAQARNDIWLRFRKGL